MKMLTGVIKFSVFSLIFWDVITVLAVLQGELLRDSLFFFEKDNVAVLHLPNALELGKPRLSDPFAMIYS